MSGKYNNTTNLFDKKTDCCFFYTDYIPDMFLVKGGYSKKKAIDIFRKNYKDELFNELMSSDIFSDIVLDLILDVEFFNEPIRERINYNPEDDGYVLSPRVDLKTGIQEAWVFYRKIDISDLDKKDLEVLKDIKETFKVGE